MSCIRQGFVNLTTRSFDFRKRKMAQRSYFAAVLSFIAIICANSIHQGVEQSSCSSSAKGRGDRSCALFVHNTPSLQVYGNFCPSGGFACRNHPATIGVFRKHIRSKLSGSWRRNKENHGLTLSQGSDDVSSELSSPANRSSEQESQDNAAYNRGVGGREMDPLHRPIIEKLREASQNLPLRPTCPFIHQ